MNKDNNSTKIAAVGDIHVKETDRGKWTECFKAISEKADILLICGDLTDTGKPEEAAVLYEELHACRIPVVSVLGNHDYDHGKQEEIKEILQSDDFHLLDGDSIVINDIGFAGVKGFGGGFDNFMLSMFGEKMIKKFVQESVDESLKLDKALMRLDSLREVTAKIVLLHYSPIKATVIGEPEQIYPFLGSSRLADPINRRNVDVVFHGHAHVGTFEGQTSKGVKVMNVAKPLLLKMGMELPFYLYEVNNQNVAIEAER